ncbi:MAG TPA: hypothetical protein VLW52_15220 [Opitutaceae bacterium]|nr:hypothetical protein [Opitutaceae bacterium]
MLEILDTTPDRSVPDAEYRRLLGFPHAHVPSERARELAAWARRWYAEHGRPWIYLRAAELEITGEALRVDGVKFDSKQLHEHLLLAGARRVVLAAVTAGRGCEEHARRLWQEGKPDEYFFLEIYGSAVVEHLAATASGRICALAESDGLIAVPHYSPGYAGWDVADQTKLFTLIRGGQTRLFPEPVEVLSSGMMRPKKSLLAVFGLTARTPRALATARLVPCQNCSFSPCQYRRAPYRHIAYGANTPEAPAPRATASAPPLVHDGQYTVKVHALRKWAGDRLRRDRRADGSIEMIFRFDGTTCSNLGRPLAFDYRVLLSAPEDGCTILQADCRPAPGDQGHALMCAYLNDATSLRHALAVEKPLLGRPLNDVLAWARPPAPSGCYCSADSRAHKWGLVLETMHYALVHAGTELAPRPAPAGVKTDLVPTP